jgi:hypothetical protein
VLPRDVVSTGEPSLNAFAAALGMGFDPWQRDLNRLALAKRQDGSWAARNSDMSIPRQAGKTHDVGLIAVHRCVQIPGLRVIWTAHHFAVIKDTFESLAELATMPEMLSQVDPVHGILSGAGNEQIRFRNGSRIYFKARERGALRGFKNIGLLIIDEAQILSDSALASMLPTQNRATNPQTFFMGTPPGPRDQGEVFTRHRTKALSGDTDSTLWVEFSADRDAKSDDRSQWMRANPSYPEHTSDEAIQQLLDDLAPDDFRREALGIWDEAVSNVAIDPKKWEFGKVSQLRLGGTMSFGLDMPPDRSSLAIGACVKYDDGTAHIELEAFKDAQHEGTAWAVDWLEQRWPKTAAVVIDAQSPALSLLPDLKSRHIRVTVTNTRELGQACGRFMDMLNAGSLHHLDDEKQPQLAEAVKGAIIRPLGAGGAFAWNKLGSDIDISPLAACTLALHGAFTTKRHPRRKQKVMV